MRGVRAGARAFAAGACRRGRHAGQRRQRAFQRGLVCRTDSAFHLAGRAAVVGLRADAGADLHRVGGKYSDERQRLHLISPRDLVPESIMSAYPWLEKTPADADSIQAHIRALRAVGVLYTDAEIAAAPAEVKGKTELDAMVAYLQGLGLALK